MKNNKDNNISTASLPNKSCIIYGTLMPGLHITVVLWEGGHA